MNITMNRIKIIFLFISITFLLFSNVFSEETKFSNGVEMQDKRLACKTYFEKLSQSTDNTVRNFYSFMVLRDYGFWFKDLFDEEQRKYIYDKDSKGNFKVGHIYNFDTASKIDGNDSILSVNDQKLTSAKQYLDIVKNENIDEINVVLLNEDNKKYSVNIKKTQNHFKYLQYTIHDFNITDIDIKKGTYDLTIKNSFKYSYETILSNSKLEHKILQYALGNILYYNHGQKKNIYHICDIPEKIFDEKTLLDPSEGIIVKDVLKNDKDLETIMSEIMPFHKLIGSDRNEIEINKEIFSVIKVKNNFNLRSFPFDKQIIKFQIIDDKYSLDTRLISATHFSHEIINNFMKKDDIPGWEKISYNFKKEPFTIPTQKIGTYSDSLLLSIIIERKPGYYVFKVIFPILLILLICWSVVWVDPKELEARLTITIVCLLSLIAYNFVIDSELPKLEYLTVLDWIILISYIYATIPNLLSIISFRLLKTNLPLGEKIEQLSKRYGLASYVILIVFIVALNANTNFEHSSSLLSWMAPR